MEKNVHIHTWLKEYTEYLHSVTYLILFTMAKQIKRMKNKIPSKNYYFKKSYINNVVKVETIFIWRDLLFP
jgi:hypothetical protein